MNLIWSPEAIDDLASIRQYIAQDDPRAARKVVSAIITLIERQLPQFPRSGRKGRVAGTLELVVPRLPFVVPYRLNGDDIEILRVYHGARIWPDQL
ncbi:MAG: type II toxin-antitoxin system RelE/ParE family toxin [Alphaproteobacteria bacterium]|nr:type II toxin-antitoxin system RelE/ParE family toxin [Alphaproteobacteria bacterium]